MRPGRTIGVRDVDGTTWNPAISQTTLQIDAHTRGQTVRISAETTPRNERACKFGTSYDSRRQICPRTRHGLFVKKMSLASLAIGGFTMGAADGGVAKMDVSLDDIIKQVRTTPCIDIPENYNCCLKRALWF